MIRLQNILFEETRGSFQDLGPDTFSAMSEPVFTGTVSSYEPELGGFKFNSNNTIATKKFLGKSLTLSYSANKKFNVEFGGKKLGQMSLKQFEDWLRKTKQQRNDYSSIAPIVNDLKSLGFKASKDPKTGYDSYVKYVKTWWANTTKQITPDSEFKKKGLWSCTTVIRVFKQSGDKWLIRAQILPDSMDTKMLDVLKNREARSVGTGSVRSGHREKTKNFLGIESDEFIYDTPKSVKSTWDQDIRQATELVQKIPATDKTVISKVKQLESNIRNMGGLVGPYNRSGYRWNRLIQLINYDLTDITDL
jgi:hypothetical protein